MTVEFLTLEDLLALAADLGVPAVRDLGLLDAAAKRPQTSLYGRDAYTGIHEKAAVLLESLTRNHALIDGNKRLGWLATYVFYA
ncbi:MAG TPA: Fic family protein, partial [Rhodoglobus sp.]|nr:Fic family protein [Rhodoglobus sp.]